MLKKILICVLMVLVVAAVVIPVVALRDRITKIETDTSDKSDLPEDTEQPEEDNGPYTVTLSSDYPYECFGLMSLDNEQFNSPKMMSPGSSFECKEFSVWFCSAGGEFYLYETASGKTGWFEGEKVFKLTEDITILYAIDGDIVRAGGAF